MSKGFALVYSQRLFVKNSRISSVNNILNIIKCNGDDYKHNLFNQGLMRYLSSDDTVNLPETLVDTTNSNLVVFNNVLTKHNDTITINPDTINPEKNLSYNDFICCDNIAQDISECWNNEST